MDVATYLDHLRADAAALLAAQRADPTAPVVTCPGWDRTALLSHVAFIHCWARTQLAAGTEERIGFKATERPPEGDELPGWFEAGAASLVDALAAMDTAATWPTWAGPQPGTFFPRRMAQETAMHRHDALPDTALDAALAVDGIDEHLALFAPLAAADGLPEATIHLHATDRDGEWLITLGPGGISATHGHAKGDVAVRGTAADLLLWVWNRQAPGAAAAEDPRYEVFGAPDVLDAWSGTVRF